MDGDAPLSGTVRRREQALTRPRRGVRGAALAALALAALGGLLLWLMREPERRPRPSAEAVEPSEQPRSAPAARPAARDRAPVQQAAVSAAAAEAPHRPGDPSHPITPEHLRAYRENGFRHSIDNAILVKDYQAIRQFIIDYEREFPDAGQTLRDAYGMIADCLEEKTPERVARARHFWETQRSSTARRDLRKLCLQ